MRTLVLGGTRSGKSAYAESLLSDCDDVCYVATLLAVEGDDEMAERIRCHRQRRPGHWRVVDAGTDLIGVLEKIAPETTVLVDGLTLWLGALLGDGTAPINDVHRMVDDTVARLALLPRVVVVSDEVGGGLVPQSPLARRFRDVAGDMHQALAAAFDRVVLVTAGLPMELKGPKE